MSITQPDLTGRCSLDANRKPRFGLDVVPEPGGGRTLRIGLRLFYPQYGSEQIQRRSPRVRQMIEHGDDGYPLGRQIETVAAPAAQCAAMADGCAAKLGRAGKA